MSTATHFFACHKIGVPHPDIELIATGTWNPDGTPIMRKAGMSIMAGTIFPVTLLQGGDAEVERLLEMGAIRHLTETEAVLFEREQKGA